MTTTSTSKNLSRRGHLHRVDQLNLMRRTTSIISPCLSHAATAYEWRAHEGCVGGKAREEKWRPICRPMRWARRFAEPFIGLHSADSPVGRVPEPIQLVPKMVGTRVSRRYVTGKCLILVNFTVTILTHMKNWTEPVGQTNLIRNWGTSCLVYLINSNTLKIRLDLHKQTGFLIDRQIQ